MKRTGSNSGNSSNDRKKYRGDDFGDEPSFEDELMMMDDAETLMDGAMVDFGEGEEVSTINLPQRWIRPEVPEALSNTTNPLG